MNRIRVIPVLLLQNGKLVKSVKFRDHKYVGDPVNTVKIFNDKEVDEIAILDISATAAGRGPDISMIKKIVSEAFMPVAYGGGITSLMQIHEIISAGVEKVILNTSAYLNPSLIESASESVGSQSIVISMDVKKNMFGTYKVYACNGTMNTNADPPQYALKMETWGAGEIILNAINRDGCFNGYDLKLIESVASVVNIPVVALGGASQINDFRNAVLHGASAVAAGSMFVYQQPHRAVLVSYPQQAELKEKLFSLSAKSER